ncbi:MAG: hypothetical protein L0Y39_04170 [Methylococcaceae bacterium]|nr:hypothetical protein [Methylococcaceae bacterium]
MEQPSTWQIILYGALALLVIFWFRPGIKASLERSRNAKKDWLAVLVPIAVVVAFMIFLIAMT